MSFLVASGSVSQEVDFVQIRESTKVEEEMDKLIRLILNVLPNDELIRLKAERLEYLISLEQTGSCIRRRS